MRPAHNRGFTLLEIMVAMTIIGIGLPIAFSSLSSSARSIERIDGAYRRAEQAKNLLAQLDLAGPISPGDRAQGQFDDGSRWNIEAVRSFPPLDPNDRSNLLRITLTLRWNGRAGEQNWTLTTYRYFRPAADNLLPLDARLNALR